MNQTRILYIFTRTPLHVGAGSSVGAIDQPIQRERHTGFPIIPGSSLKGSFADAWNEEAALTEGAKKGLRVTTRDLEDGRVEIADATAAAWLFGSNNEKASFAGVLQFREASLLAFPVRSVRGCFAWITSPLMLQRAKRDGVISGSVEIPSPSDEQACFEAGKLEIRDSVVLEEYTLKRAGGIPADLGAAFQKLLPQDPILSDIRQRLIVVSDGMASFFATSACEVAQHVRIDDETGTAAKGMLFNQENLPSETLLYSVVSIASGRGKFQGKTPDDAAEEFKRKLSQHGNVFQFGGDATTGLGFCTVQLV